MIEKQRNIFIIGPMGAGKTTIGRQLAKSLNRDFFDSDQEIEKRTGVNISWIFDIEGETGFRIREEKIISEISKKKGIVLSTGGGSINSKKNRKCLSNLGLVVYLSLTVEKQLIRINKDKNRISSNKNLFSYDTLEKIANERNPLYQEIADITISTDKYHPKFVINHIINMFKRRE